ncbi:MAG: transcriptional repressor, partial [Bdellovibrionaceae bacterium]|nr:transcriptional repressor [Pseudobdellovibrionaceae bacterium]
QGVLGLEDLQQALSKRLPKVDRVSLYRTLRLFEELRWIHKVDDGRYMFCRHRCERHAHWMLSCDSCGQVRELTDHSVIEAFGPWLKKLGFSERHNGLITGVCESCALG